MFDWIKWQWILMPFELIWEKLGWWSIPFGVFSTLLLLWLYYRYGAGVRGGKNENTT